jgi:hypothetical protein
MPKWVALTVRKLKPGTYADWREAWKPDEWPEGVHAYICRKVDDPDEIVAFGIVEASREGVEEMREEPSAAEARKARMAPYVDSVESDGFYEVIDEVSG